MASQPPPENSGGHGFRAAMRSRLQRAKDALIPSRHGSPLSENSDLVNTSSFTNLFSDSQATVSLLSRGRKVPQLTDTVHQNATSSTPKLPSTANDSTQDAGISVANSQKASDNTSWSKLATSLHTLEAVTDLFPPLKAAVGSFIGCLDIVQSAALNHKDYKQLADELAAMADSINQYGQELDSETNNGSIANIARCIEDQVAWIKHKDERGTMSRIRDATEDRDDVIRCYKQIGVLFRQLQCDVTMRTRSDVKKQLEITLLRGISPVDDAMYNSSYSTAIRRHGCTAETRESTQKTLQAWATDPNGAKIYWMNGMAGTGKTTIAYSFCQWLENDHRLGASFFCSRISSTCRSLNRIVPTIAYLLALYSPGFRSKLCAALKENPNAGALNVLQQFEKLIHQPMSSPAKNLKPGETLSASKFEEISMNLKTKDAIPDGVVIVIDALDECDDGYSVRLLLDVLFKFAADLPLKFFVSSRPEHFIRDGMIAREQASRSIMHLHDIEQSIVEGDIRKYLTEALSTMSPPPSPEQIEALSKRARNLFIYAATLVGYIHPASFHVDSNARLETILRIIKTPGAEAGSKYADLDRLYTTVLDAAFNEGLELEEKDCMRRVLWSIISAREPMTTAILASLTNLTERQTWSAVQSFRSVLHVPEDSGTGLISALHASFPEYMLDESRSKLYNCKEAQACEALAHQCFEIMNRQLYFNICKLQNSYLSDAQLPDLQIRVSQFISPALSYACRYWGIHLSLSPPSSTMETVLVGFLSNKLLFWMEVLSLTRCIGLGAPMLHQVQTWLSRVENTQKITQKQVSDARNFVTWFAANPCSQSTPHIYVSALPLCAKSSWVYQHYSECIHGLVNPTISNQDEAVLAIWSTESTVVSLAVSPDGALVASGSGHGSVYVYDTQTGAIVTGPLKGHTRDICSVVFSPDGAHLASSSRDGTVIIWDVHSGNKSYGPFHQHKDAVWSVAFSPDGNRVASGSHDQRILVWDRQTGKILAGPITGHFDVVWSVVFSPDGRLIASGSQDRTIRLWDANTGALIVDPFTGHEFGVTALSFSPNGQYIASGSYDGTVRVWNVPTGNVAFPPFEGHKDTIMSVAFSSDGTKIVSGGGSERSIILVWDTSTGAIIAGPLYGHVSWINSVTFFPDGTRAISGSEDCTIRTWHTNSTKSVTIQPDIRQVSLGPVAFSPDCSQFISYSSTGALNVWGVRSSLTIPHTFPGIENLTSIDSVAFSPQGTLVAASANDFVIHVWNPIKSAMSPLVLEGHKGSVRCITFSSDDKHICSGSDDTLVMTWDIRTSDPVANHYRGHTATILSVAYSLDSTRIASGAVDATVRVWDTATNLLIHNLDMHTSPVTSVAFSPTSAILVSAGVDGSVHKWDFYSGKHQEELKAPEFSKQLAGSIGDPSYDNDLSIPSLPMSPVFPNASIPVEPNNAEPLLLPPHETKADRQHERKRRHREREERRRERKLKNKERAETETEQEQMEQDGEKKHKERESPDQTQHYWACNPPTAAPFMVPKLVVSPSLTPEMQNSTSSGSLGESGQITFPIPYITIPLEETYGAPAANIGSPSANITGPDWIGTGPSRTGEGPSGKGEYPSRIEEDLSHMTRPSDNTVLPHSITPLSVSNDHHILYSCANKPGNAIVDPISDSYNYIALTPAIPMSLHAQSTPMKMPSPEPWREPNDPPRRSGANEAAIYAHIRAVEELRKLQLGEDDEEEEKEIQRHIKAKFGDLRGSYSDSDEDSSGEESSDESELSTKLRESTGSDSQQSSSPNGSLDHHSDRYSAEPPNRDHEGSSLDSLPGIVPSNDSKYSPSGRVRLNLPSLDGSPSDIPHFEPNDEEKHDTQTRIDGSSASRSLETSEQPNPRTDEPTPPLWVRWRTTNLANESGLQWDAPENPDLASAANPRNLNGAESSEGLNYIHSNEIDAPEQYDFHQSTVAFSTDGERIVSTVGSTIRIFEAESGELVSTMFVPENEVFHSAGFFPNSTDIVSVSRLQPGGDSLQRPRDREQTPQEIKGQTPNIIRVWRSDASRPSASASANCWSYNPDGRITSDEGLVIWVPPDLIPQLRCDSKSYYNPFILSSDGVIDIGYEDLCIGDRWSECYAQKRSVS